MHRWLQYIFRYINVRMHKPADQDPKALEKFTIYVMETGRLMIQPPVETACLIFDMTGFSLANMDYKYVTLLLISGNVLCTQR